MLRMIGIVGSIALFACVTPEVETVHRPGYAVARDARVRAEVDASGSSDDAASVESLESMLRSRATRILANEGQRVVPGGDADLIVLVQAAIESDLSRTWSSEPGVSVVREVEREAVVVRVRVLDAGEGEDVWRSEARTRLPRNRLPFMPTRDEVYARTLEAAFRDFDLASE